MLFFNITFTRSNEVKQKVGKKTIAKRIICLKSASVFAFKVSNKLV